MNLYNIILLIGVLFSGAMAIIVYLSNRRNSANLIFAILSVIISFTAYINFLISMCDSADEVYALLPLISFRTLIFPVSIHFFLLLIRQGKLLRNIWFYLLLYLYPAILILFPNPHDMFHLKYLGEDLGWNFYPVRDIFSDIVVIWIFLLNAIIVYLAILNVIRAKESTHRKQAWFVLTGFIVGLIVPMVFDLLFPLHGIEMPQTASSSFLFGFILIGYAIIRYELFSATPESAADDIINNVSDAVILVQPFGSITFANKAAENLTGYSSKELRGMSINLFFDWIIIDELRNPGAEIRTQELITATGKRVPVMISHTSLYLRNNKLNGHAFIIHEITELQNLINQLAEREIRYKNIFDNIQGVYFELLPDSTITEISPSVTHLTSYDREEIIGLKFSVLFPDEITWDYLLDMVRSEKKVSNFEATMVDRLGSQHYCVINAMYLYKSGQPQKIVGSVTNIDDLKIAELRIIESEKRYRLVTENSSDFVAQMREDGIFEYISPSFRSFGHNPKDFVGTQGNELVHPDDLPDLQKTIRETKEKRDSFLKEFRMLHAKGHYLWVEARCNWAEADGQLYMIINAYNISLRKEIEEKLKESEESYRLLFEQSSDGILLARDIYTHVSANKALLKIFGYESFEELQKEPPYSLVIPDDIDNVIERDRLRKERIPILDRNEMKIRRKDGQIRHLEYQVNEVMIKDERFLQIIVRDITDKMEAQRKLVESEKKYSLLVENSPDDIFLFDRDGMFIACNSHAERALGLGAGELTGKYMREVFPPDIAERQLASVRKVFETGKMSEYLKTFTRTAMGDRWYSTALVPIKDSSDNVISVIGIARDITEVEVVELKIRRNEERYRLFLENFQGIAIRTRLNGHIEFLYGEVAEVTGYTIEEFFSGIPRIWKMIHPEDRLQVLRAIKMLTKIASSKITSECRIISRNGRIRYLRVFMQNLMDDQGNPAYIQAAIFDKTDIYELQNKIINTIVDTEDKERMRFAEDLHDDLGPLLSTIRIYLNIIQSKGNDQEKERLEIIEYTKQLIDDAVQQARNISYNIMPEILSLYGLIPSVKSFCNKIDKASKVKVHIIAENIKEDQRFDNKLELALHRAVKELVNNTLKHAGAANITMRFFRTDEYYMLEYTDDGRGFVLEEKIKAASTLGLRNIFHRIESVNGTINMTSAPGAGIKVLIRWK